MADEMDERMNAMSDKMIVAIMSLKHKPLASFSIMLTKAFPLAADDLMDIPIGTRSMIIFPKGPDINNAQFLIDGRLTVKIPAGAVYPWAVQMLPQTRSIVIPMAQPGNPTAGQFDLVFSSEIYNNPNA